MATALFPFGQVFITPRAQKVCASFPVPPDLLIVRHVTGDWFAMSPEDRAANERAIRVGARVFSMHVIGSDWFIVSTEADRSSTTIMLAEEY
jgi:hypothetical protein